MRLQRFERSVQFLSVSRQSEYDGFTETPIGTAMSSIAQSDPGVVAESGPKIDSSTAVLGLRPEEWSKISDLKVDDHFVTDDGIKYAVRRIVTDRPGTYSIKVSGVKN